MARITIADLEDDVVKVLKHRSELHGRSLSEEIRAALGRETAPDRAQALERLARKRKQLASGAFPEPGADEGVDVEEPGELAY
ncbi:MAG: FitA-like ribbon-helix-helix domain-containing protein [Acidobacteriota bacterium]